MKILDLSIGETFNLPENVVRKLRRGNRIMKMLDLNHGVTFNPLEEIVFQHHRGKINFFIKGRTKRFPTGKYSHITLIGPNLESALFAYGHMLVPSISNELFKQFYNPVFYKNKHRWVIKYKLDINKFPPYYQVI